MSSKKKAIREIFRLAVFERDGYKCVVCKNSENLDAHHITDRNEMPNGGYVKENGITLCPQCHKFAEVWHESNHTQWMEGFHPTTLYSLIKSSKERAIKASEKILNWERIEKKEDRRETKAKLGFSRIGR